MALNLYALLDSEDPSNGGLVKSFFDDSPADPPKFRRGDYLKYRIHHLKRNPLPTPGRPFVYGTRPNTLRVGAGVIDAVPDSGTYTLTGPNGGTTAAISKTADQATIQAALRAGWTGGSDIVVTVHSTGGVSTYYTIDWGNTGAETGVPSADSAGLVPSGSSVSIVNSQDGTSLLNEKWEVRLHKALPFLCTSWTAFAGVTTAGTLVQAGSTTAGKIYSIGWNSDAVDGATYWPVSTNGTNIETVGPIAYNATEDEVAEVINRHSALDDSEATKVRVKQAGPGSYTVIFPLSFANGPTVGATASSNSLIVPVGDEAEIAVSVAGSNAILGTDTEADITFEIEASESADRPGTLVQLETALYKDLLGNAPGYQTGADVFLTESSLNTATRAIVKITTDSSTVASLAPDVDGQIAVATDEFYNLYRAIGTSAGDWSSAFGALVFYAQQLRAQGVSAAISAKTANYTLTATDHTVTFDVTSGDITATLPDATLHSGRIFAIKRTDGSANNLTVDPHGAQTIDGGATWSGFAQNDVLTIQSDGANWKILSYYAA